MNFTRERLGVKESGIKTLWVRLTVRHGIDGPNRNIWFTVLKNGGSFHGYVSHNQMV